LMRGGGSWCVYELVALVAPRHAVELGAHKHADTKWYLPLLGLGAGTEWLRLAAAAGAQRRGRASLLLLELGDGGLVEGQGSSGRTERTGRAVLVRGVQIDVAAPIPLMMPGNTAMAAAIGSTGRAAPTEAPTGCGHQRSRGTTSSSPSWRSSRSSWGGRQFTILPLEGGWGGTESNR
jgi:hypothetical protein